MSARIFLYDVGVSNVASLHDLNNNYINFLNDLRMANMAESVTQIKTDYI